jgi:zinc and cadmium transporter
MTTLLWIIGATLLDSLIGLVGVFSLFVREDLLKRVLKTLVAFSAGALLGGAFFHLMPESFEKMSAILAFGIAIIGFLAFFVLEEYLHWHNCEECDIHPYSYLMIIGDSVHNVLDGLVIAGTFMVNIQLGIVTTMVIVAHEVPQELGVFGVLVSGGFDKTKAILYSFMAQCTCVLGGILAYLFFSQAALFSAFIVPFAAGGFLYIAAADLIPSMHETEGFAKVTSFIWLCTGILFMLYIKLAFSV